VAEVAVAEEEAVQVDIDRELHQLFNKHIQSQSDQVALEACGQITDLAVITQVHLE
jgi:hypothetical protein